MSVRPTRRGLTLLETIIALALIVVLMSILLPALSTARVTAYREHCSDNQRRMGLGWLAYLDDHQGRFPSVPVQPGWRYGGVRFSRVDDSCTPDFERPLTPYLHLPPRSIDQSNIICNCPADRGVSDPTLTVLGTGRRTAFRSFGTSYRANAALVDARLAGPHLHTNEVRGLRREEITTPPSRMVVMGDPVWYEQAEETGRMADWHGRAHTGNLLFLDGSVRFMAVRPRASIGPAVIDPVMPGTAPPAQAPQRQ